MSPLFSEDDALNKINTLVLINILEPVTKEIIIKSLGNNINNKQMGLILSELISDGFVAKEKDYYRTTYIGSSFSISRKANQLRDIHRMKHLLAISKQRGGDYVGR